MWNTYGDQSKIEKNMLGCIEHKVRNISFMHPNQKIEFYDFSGKIDQPMWIAAVFEWMNEPVDSNNDKFKERNVFKQTSCKRL